MRNIGTNIRTLRTQQGVTQEELAEKLFVTRQAVSSYETGRTKPDIEMLIKIAEVLNTDTNTLLYGLPSTENSKKDKWALILGAAATLLLGLLYVGCEHYLIYQIGHRIVLSVPQNLLRITILPAMWFAAGWTLFHGLMTLPGMPKIQFKHQKWVYSAVWLLLGIVAILQLPYIIYLATATYRSLTHSYVSMSFPNIPIYTKIANALLVLTIRANASCAIWGAFIRFLRPSKQ